MGSSTELGIENAGEGPPVVADELDVEGLPLLRSISSSSSSDESDREDCVAHIECRHQSEFAEDFYRCGADWSSLAKAKNGKDMVQRNLFQMWGIKKPSTEGSTAVAVAMSPPRKREKRGLIAGWRVDRKSESDQPRVCPFYKKIPGTPFTVDAFRYGKIDDCSAYFLSHFHSDHYGGLTKKWSHGPIYCSKLTARLVRMCLSVNPVYICPLDLGTEYDIHGIKVTMLEANHCPGAALIYFRLQNGSCILHTGDFRASKQMQAYPLLAGQQIDVLYLDTTYCNPKYRFPPKEDVISFVVRVTIKHLKKQPKTLIVVGAYSIGKENVYVAVSQALGVQIYTSASRRRILQLFEWPELSGNLCSCGKSSPLHVLPLSLLRVENLKGYLKNYMQHYEAVLAFRPTGWTFSETSGGQLDQIQPITKGNITIYGVPYSEHSSFPELREFVKFLKPLKIIPTVNIGNAANRKKIESYFKDFAKD